MFLAPLALLASLGSPARAAVKNPTTFVALGSGGVETLDPAWASDTASLSVLFNVYEKLFQFQGHSTTELAPLLAQAVPTRANGLISADGRTYRIPIRQGVLFHDGSPMTAEDVRYSLLRAMLQDRAGGPSSALLEPLTGLPSTRDAKGAILPEIWDRVAAAATIEGDSLVLRLPRPCPYLLKILAGRTPLIVSKRWAIAHGDWDGTQAAWRRFNNPQKQSSPFHARTNGTGPFELVRWDPAAHEIVLRRNERYWRRPARLERVILREMPDFSTAKLMLVNGDADTIVADIPRESALRGLPGVDILDAAPDIGTGFDLFFTYRVDAKANRFIGSGRLDGEGVPPGFFADKDIRLAFAYAIDYDAIVKELLHGRGTQSRGCIPRGLFGYDADAPRFRLDLAKAEAHLRRAFDGRAWEKGFSLTLASTDDPIRQALGQMLKRNLESLNPRVKIEVRALDWPAFASAYRSSQLPVFIAGFSGKYPDPHAFAFEFLHSRGLFPAAQRFSLPELDRLVEQARVESEPGRRAALYSRITRLEHEEVPHVVVVDVSRYRAQRSWVKGWVDNPIFPDSPYGTYFYPIYKE